MSAHRPDLTARDSVSDEQSGRSRGITSTRIVRRDSVGDFHHAFGIRRTFETGEADDLILFAKKDTETIAPGIGARGLADVFMEALRDFRASEKFRNAFRNRDAELRFVISRAPEESPEMIGSVRKQLDIHFFAGCFSG